MYPGNDDIDEVFRRAAAGYPLNTGTRNWNLVYEKLHAAKKPVSDKVSKWPARRYVLLMLIPFTFIFHNPTRYLAGIGPVSKTPVIQPVAMNEGKKGRVTTISTKSVPATPAPAPGYRQKQLAASLPHTVAYEMEAGRIPEPILPTEPVNEADKQMTEPRPLFKKGIYLGAHAGIDFGSVKAQSLTTPGYNVGLLLGYRFNKRFSFETGISWIKKKYYTRGEFFSMSKIESSMPAGAEMMKVNGQLSLLEIPYKVKYDFAYTGNAHFFITAGGSSNIYIRETNQYFTRLNGVQEAQKTSYDGLHCSPLCLLHFSAGYEKKLRNQALIRLEPYLKLPLQKVGMGAVPVVSVGLNVSVSHILDRH